MSLFSAVEMAPRDPILGLNEALTPIPARIKSTSVLVFIIMKRVASLCLKPLPWLKKPGRKHMRHVATYLLKDWCLRQCGAKLIFGSDANITQSGRVITSQAIGGTGALKIGADYLKRLLPDAVVAISNPSWENHRALFESAGFPVKTTVTTMQGKQGINLEGMLEDLRQLPAQSIIVLHACCHNPTGVDLTPEQWLAS